MEHEYHGAVSEVFFFYFYFFFLRVPIKKKGLFGYPKELAARCALQTVADCLIDDGDSFDRIVFNVFTPEDEEIYTRLVGDYFGGGV